MINEHVCQFCGKDPGEKPEHVEELGRIPFCVDCAREIRRWLKKNGRSRAIVEVNVELYQTMQLSPIRLLRGAPVGRPKRNCIYYGIDVL
jgi:hypothetical protein